MPFNPSIRTYPLLVQSSSTICTKSAQKNTSSTCTDNNKNTISNMANNKTEMSTEEPHNNDVLCGRGGTINAHPGNEQYRKFVDRKKRVYLTARFKREKRLIAQSIVDEVRSLKPPGRFLLKDAKTNIWSDVGDEKARDKTSQALRENALTVRKQMEKEYQESYKKQIREDAIAKGLDPDVAVEKITSSVMGDINEYDGKANSVKPSEMVENEKKKKQQQQQQAAVAAKSKKTTAKQQQTTTTSATTTAAAQQQAQQQLQAQQQMQASLSPVAQADNQWLLQQQQQHQAQLNQAVGYSYLPQQAGIVDQHQQQMNTLQSIQQQQQQAAQFQQQFLSAPQGVTQQPQLSQSAPQSIQPTNEEYQQFLKWKESQQQQQQAELQQQALQAAQQAAQLQAVQAQSQQPQHTIAHQSTMSAAHAQWTANNQPVHIAAPPPTHTTITAAAATTTNNSNNNNPPVTAINLRPSRNMPSSLNSSRDSSPSTTDRHVQFSQSNMTDYTPPDHDQSISSPRSEHHSTTNMSQAMSQHTPLTFLSTDMSVKTSDSLNYYLQGLEDEISGDVGQEVELIAHAPMLDGSLSDTIGPPQPRNVSANQQQQHHGGIPSYTRSTPPRHGSSSHSHKSGNSKSSRSRRSRKRRSGNHIPSNSGKVQLDLSNLGGPSSSGAPTYQPVTAAAGGMGYQQSGGVILPTPIRNTSSGSAKRSPPSSAMAPPPALVPLLSPGGNHLYQQAQSNMSVPMSPGSMVNSLDLDKMSLCETENVSTHGGSIGGASLCNVFDDQDNSIIGSIGSGGRAAMMDMTMSLGSHPSSGGNSGGSTTQPPQQSGDDANSLQNMQPLGYQYSGENESLIGASSALMDMSVGSHSKHSGSGSGSKNSGGSSTSRASRRSGSPASIDKADVKIIHQQFVNEGREQPPGGQQETPTPMPGQDYNFWDGKRAE